MIGGLRVVASVDAIVVGDSVTVMIGGLRVVASVDAIVVGNSVTMTGSCGNVVGVLLLFRITMTSI
jgi:hypothetical protein